MERKKVEGPIRNREKSKEKLLAAVGKILMADGFAGLKVNNVATTAGLDKKLIYNYFGGMDQLIDEYLRSQDFWSNVRTEDIAVDTSDGGQEFSKQMLLSQFDYIGKNKELQKIILWSLAEQRKSLKKMTDAREEVGEVLFRSITDPHFGDQALRYRSVVALIISGLYYLNIFSNLNTSTFCGLDVRSEDGRAAIKDAVTFMIDKAYENTGK